jgi:hypothetical protein
MYKRDEDGIVLVDQDARPVQVSEHTVGIPASILGKQNVHFSALFVFQLK